MASPPPLITLLPAKDCDVGRWVLQHHDVAYKEHPHAPIFHVIVLYFRGLGEREYPVLVRPEGQIATTPKLLEWCEANAEPSKKLMPDKENEPELYDEVDKLQQYARRTIGGAVVDWSYFHLLKYKSVVWQSITTGVPWYEKFGCLIGFPLIRALMYRGIPTDQATADKALITLREGFDTIDTRLSDGRQYMAGDRFTFADIAVAASWGPMLLAQGYEGMLPPQAMCPAYMADVYREFRERPTGQFIQRMYDQHRRKPDA